MGTVCLSIQRHIHYGKKNQNVRRNVKREFYLHNLCRILPNVLTLFTSPPSPHRVMDLTETKTPAEAVADHKRTGYKVVIHAEGLDTHCTFQWWELNLRELTPQPRDTRTGSCWLGREDSQGVRNLERTLSPLLLTDKHEGRVCFHFYSPGSLSALGMTFCCCLSRDKKCVFRFSYLILNFTLGI